MNRKIRFLHIPKTAGSTFDECLFLLYLRPYLLRQQFVFSGDIKADKQRFDRLSSSARSGVAICTGHAPRLTNCAEIDAMPTVTLLRDPVERVKSFCQHVSEGKSPQIYSPEKQGPFDLNELLGSGRIQLNNFQSRLVLGEGGYSLSPGDEGALVNKAMRMLETQFSGYGLTDDIDRSLLLFKEIMGWRKWPVYRSRNSKNSQALVRFEAHHLARIEELNSIDIAFYRMASEGFYQRLQEHCPNLEEQIYQFRLVMGKSQWQFAIIDLARGLGRVARTFQRPGASAAVSR